jgi:Icc-related predicted phosphoesterase
VKINCASDLHFEFLPSREAEQEIVDKLADADVLVLAGDITMARFLDQARDTFRPFVEKFGNVVLVPGNHEYYRSEPSQVDGILAVLEQELFGLHVLKPGKVVTINGQRFMGGTLWFPDGPYNLMRSGMLNDFRYIKNFTPWVYEQNTLFRKHAEELVDPSMIVVSHHLPSMKSVAPKYMNDPGNIFFVSDEERLISWRQPKLWVHGHTHEACDYKIGETRVVCNPRGYPHEGKPFNYAKIVEV